MKNILVVLLPILLLGWADESKAQMISGQSVEMEYDALGNRVVRKVWVYSQGGGTAPFQSDDVNSSIVAYPNPAHDQLTLRTKITDGISEDSLQQLSMQVSIVNSLGQVVDQELWSSEDLEIDFNVSQLPTGVYNVVLFPIGDPSRQRTIRFIHP